MGIVQSHTDNLPAHSDGRITACKSMKIMPQPDEMIRDPLAEAADPRGVDIAGADRIHADSRHYSTPY